MRSAGVKRYHTDAPPASHGLSGSPGSLVASTLLPSTATGSVEPRSIAATNASLAGASAHAGGAGTSVAMTAATSTAIRVRLEADRPLISCHPTGDTRVEEARSAVRPSDRTLPLSSP